MIRRKMILPSALLLLMAACGTTEPADPEDATEAPTSTPAPATTTTLPVELETTRTATTAASTTSTAAAPEAQAMQLVDDLYATINSGNVPDAVLLMADDVRQHFTVATRGVNAQFTYSCERLGRDDIQIRCVEYVWDDFYGPAGISLTNEVTYGVRGDRLRVVDGYTCPAMAPHGGAWEYLKAFDQWLNAEVGRWVLWQGEPGQQLLPCTPYPFFDLDVPERSPQVAREMVELVPRFLADSTAYPLGELEALTLVDEYYEALGKGERNPALGRLGAVNLTHLSIARALNASFEHECEIIPPKSLRLDDSVLVRCVETMYDDFYRPGELALESTMTFRVRDGRLTVDRGFGCWATEPPGDLADYMFDFQQWLRSQHRWVPGMIALLDASPISMPCGAYPFTSVPDEASLETLRTELAAFVAASPDWPKAS